MINVKACATRQYWEGQYDALMHWSEVLSKLATQEPTNIQLQRIATAAKTKAILIGRNKLRKDNDHGQHA